ncbi:MAG: PPC domain-containing DNA-binding protein [Planctomycetota bacterium]|jgi:predicted DNA-binding protein with PD1-like motif
MHTKEKDNLIFLRLFPDQDMFKKLQEACRRHGVETAIAISGLGQLKNFELGYFKEKGNYCLQLFKEPHELLSLTGNISKQNEEYNFHLHAVLGSENKHVVGGHLMKGIVEVTNEIVLLKTDIKIKRVMEEETGLQGMFLE